MNTISVLLEHFNKAEDETATFFSNVKKGMIIMRIPNYGSAVFKQKSILKNWIVSYLLILIIPIISALASSSYTRDILTKEIAASNKTMLNSMVNGIDNTAERMQSILDSIAVDSRFTKLLSLDSGRTSFINLLPDTVKMLYSYQFSSPDTEILIYIPERDYLVTRSTANTSKKLYSSMKSSNSIDISYEEYFKNLNGNFSSYSWYISNVFSYPNATEKSVVLARTFYASTYPKDSKYSATIYVSVPLSFFTSFFSSSAENSLLIFDNNNNVISTLNYDGDTPSLDLQSVVSDNLKIHINNTSYIASGIRSAACNWTFVVLVPEKSYWSSADYTAIVTAISLIFAVFIGLFSIIVLMHRNYAPVQKILKNFNIGGDKPLNENEFDLIRDAYSQMYFENQYISQRLTIQKESFQKNYLFSHLHGNSQWLSNDDLEECFNLNLSGKHFVIISFFISDDDMEDNLEATAYAIHDFWKDLFEKNVSFYQMTENHLITYLLILEENQLNKFNKIVADKLDQIIAHIKETLNIPVSVVLSDVCDDFEQLPNFYQDMIDAIKYQYVTKKSGLICTSELKRHSFVARLHQQDFETAELLYDAIRSKRYTDAESVLLCLFDSFDPSKSSSFKIDRFRVFSWANLLAEAFYTEDTNLQIKMLFRKYLSSLAECDNLFKMKDCFLKMVRTLCGEDPKTEASSCKLSYRVERYIQENYSDINLCLSSLADAMELTPKYLSQLFRSETNGGLLDYINSVRIQHAKELLENNQYTILEISSMVGYNNVKTFRRAFQKIEGTTPSRLNYFKS